MVFPLHKSLSSKKEYIYKRESWLQDPTFWGFELLVFLESLRSSGGITKNTLTFLSKPEVRTLFMASSHMSHGVIFHTWLAMLYSSIRGSWG